jgi:hypothetical protein
LLARTLASGKSNGFSLQQAGPPDPPTIMGAVNAPQRQSARHHLWSRRRNDMVTMADTASGVRLRTVICFGLDLDSRRSGQSTRSDASQWPKPIFFSRAAHPGARRLKPSTAEFPGVIRTPRVREMRPQIRRIDTACAGNSPARIARQPLADQEIAFAIHQTDIDK